MNREIKQKIKKMVKKCDTLNWVAIDKNGEIWAYESKPEKGYTYWNYYGKPNYRKIGVLPEGTFGNWEKRLYDSINYQKKSHLQQLLSQRRNSYLK